MAQDEGISLDEAYAKSATPADDADAGVSLDEAYQSGERKTVLEKLAGAPHRVVMAVGNFINQAITPSNWVAAGKNAADVVGGLFEAPSEPDPLAASPFAFTPEIRQGMVKGATHLPSMLFSDLPQAGARTIIDTLFGPGEYDQVNAIAKEQSVVPNPTDVLSSENFDRAMDVLGLTRVINGRPEEQLTSGEQTQRRFGEFLSAAPLVEAKYVLPSLTGVIPARVAEETAPDDPLWQMLAAASGPLGVEAAVRTKVPAAIKGVLPKVSPEANAKVAGEKLAAATGGKVPLEQPIPVPGLRPSLAQQTDDAALLALEAKSAAADPTLRAQLDETRKANETVLAEHEAAALAKAKTDVETLGGTGTPAEAPDLANKRAATAEAEHRDEFGKVRGESRPVDINDAAAARIEQRLTETLNHERGLWARLRAMGDSALIKVGPLQKQITDFVNGLTAVRRENLPAAFNKYVDTLNRLGKPPKEPGAVEGVEVIRPGEPSKPAPDGRVNIFELQDLRSIVRQARQDAMSGATPDRALAHHLGELETQIGKYLDSFKFEDAAVQQAYQEARNFTKQRAGVFNVPRIMRKVIGADEAGADLISSGTTLDSFLKKGNEGRDSIRQLIAADASPEMRELVVQRLASEMPDNAKAATKWLRDYEPLLTELDPAAFNRFRTVVDRLAAVEKLRSSPLGMLLDTDPEKVIAKIVASKDPAAAAQQLRSQFSGDATVWGAMKRAYADRLIKAISDPDGTLSLPKLQKFITDNHKTSSVFLDSAGAQRLKEIEQALSKALEQNKKGAEMVGRKGSATHAAAEEQKFIDLVIQAIGAGGGALFGGMEGGIAGLAAGAGVTRARNILRARGQEALREVLTDPATGSAALRKANRASLAGMAKVQRGWFEPFAQSMPGVATEAEKSAAEPPALRTIPARPGPQPAKSSNFVDSVKAKVAAAQKAATAAKPTQVADTATKPSGVRKVDRGNRRFTVTPTSNGRWIVRVDDIAPEAVA